MKKNALLLGLSACGWAQSLQILPSPPSQASVGSFQVMLTSPNAKEPVALQWKLSVPDGITMKPSDIAVDSAAESVQKAITCTIVRDQTQKENGSTCACVLAGGLKPIPNGPLAIVRVTVRPGMRSARVVLRSAIAVLPDLTSVDIQDAEGTISAK